LLFFGLVFRLGLLLGVLFFQRLLFGVLLFLVVHGFLESTDGAAEIAADVPEFLGSE